MTPCCPDCHLESTLERHCGNVECKWVRCRMCRGYGYISGRLWARGRAAT
jgi:hypothetical protein